MTKAAIAIAGILLLLAQTPAQSACELPGTLAADPPRQLVSERTLDKCFGETGDKHPLSLRTLKIQNCSVDRRNAGELRQRLLQAMRDLEDEGADLSLSATDHWRIVLSSLQAELARARESIADVQGIAQVEYWAWGPGDHQALHRADGTVVIDYGPIINSACSADAPRTECAAAMGTAVRVNRLVNLARYVHSCAATSRIEQTYKSLVSLDAAWNYYFFQTRSQYVWELGINSLRFDGKDDEFAAPPPDQLIVAHPGVAFEYIGSDAQREDAYEATVLLEVLGYNRFFWKPDRNGSPSRLPPLGASLVVTYTPDNVGERVGYGVFLHAFNKFSFGITRRDTGAGDDTTFIVSADLMRAFLNPSPEQILQFRNKKALPSSELNATE